MSTPDRYPYLDPMPERLHGLAAVRAWFQVLFGALGSVAFLVLLLVLFPVLWLVLVACGVSLLVASRVDGGRS